MGDNALNLAIRSLLGPNFRIRHIELLRNRFGFRERWPLARADLNILGGGGLFHSFGPEGQPARRTGTLWNIELRHVARLRVPVLGFGLGFNHFSGDPPPLPAMADLLELMLSKTPLVSFRNDGSVARLVDAFPQFEGRLLEIPDPGVFFRPPPAKPTTVEGGVPYGVLQLAMDRPHLRYGPHWDRVVALLRHLVGRSPVPLVLVPHTPDDDREYRSLTASLGVSSEPFTPDPEATARVIGLYAGADFTISTRGHSQICSVGNQTATFSLSTHPKVTGFAASAGIGEWCVDPLTMEEDAIVERFDRFLSQRGEIQAGLASVNERFDREISSFVERINAFLAERSET